MPPSGLPHIFLHWPVAITYLLWPLGYCGLLLDDIPELWWVPSLLSVRGLKKGILFLCFAFSALPDSYELMDIFNETDNLYLGSGNTCHKYLPIISPSTDCIGSQECNVREADTGCQKGLISQTLYAHMFN